MVKLEALVSSSWVEIKYENIVEDKSLMREMGEKK